MKKSVLTIIIGILIGTISTVLASSLLASDITYKPKDKSWGVTNVQAAIDSLKLAKTSDNYSADERVVGTWINGKPIYQKTITGLNIDITWEAQYVAWTPEISFTALGINNVDEIFPGMMGFVTNNSNKVICDNVTLRRTSSTSAIFGFMYGGKLNGITLRYTKTTD
ncbi:MAG: hypothetical protein IJ715_03890 [Bacilli bacterium]|nr:hypothetical protein [Bacilli bacterium]